MDNQYFGHYLLNKGMLRPEQLYEALDHERSIRVKLGILAVNAGLMTAAQVEEVHDLQRVRDQKFGVIAVERGYLTSEQVDQLLRSQKEGHLSLIQAIADQQYLSLAAVEKALAGFRAEYGAAALGSHSEVDDDAVIRKCIDFSAAGSQDDLLYHYVELTLRNIIRFLDTTPFLLPAHFEDGQPAAWLATQQVTGDTALSTGLMMDELVLLAIANKFSGERILDVDELALDSVGEFLNVHNGVFCSTLSQQGLVADLQPQVVQSGIKWNDLPQYRLAIGTSFGRMDLILSVMNH